MRIYSALAILALFAICVNTAPLNVKRQWDGTTEEQSQQVQSDEHADQVQENQYSSDGQSGGTYSGVDGSVGSSWS